MSEQANTQSWHLLPVGEVASCQNTDLAQGLSDKAAAERLARLGPNELQDDGGRTLWHILWEQVSSVLILILVGAGALAAFLGKYIDAGAILAIVVLFVVLGVAQEYRAQRAIAALKQMAAPLVRALRGGQVKELSSRDLVPGDIVLLEAGNVVPADVRFVESNSIRVQEAALTGESEPVEKTVQPLPEQRDLTIGDRINMGYMGTAVTFGRGRGLVVATGMQTELGRIASMIKTVRHEPTPLQRRLDGLGKALAVVAVIIAAIVAVTGWMRGEDVTLVLLTGVSLAVAIVPEGLPAVLTFTLALGGQRMLKRKALVRKLPAVETLGSVTVICSDKTGTLTQNRMTVTVAETLDGRVDLTGPDGLPSRGTSSAMGRDIRILLSGAALCNDAYLRSAGSTAPDEAVGDPTETALIVAADKAGLKKAALEDALPRVAEIAFDSDRKRMTTMHRVTQPDQPLADLFGNSSHLSITKGAVDGLLPQCRAAFVGGRIAPLTDAMHAGILASNDSFGGQGMRVLAVAARPWDAVPDAPLSEEAESDLVFLGLVAMIDPPRPEAAQAVATCRQAGIRPVMITGDHPLTAGRIASDLGICRPGDRVVTGAELERMTAEDLRAIVNDTAVYARVSPEHKLRIVEALQAQGHVVAMTGDGVNDAPALKKADIGVAMGSGTDVAREAADMVLLDDNFATIVAAVEEGRVVYDNVRRFIQFSVAGNIGKVLTVAVPPFFGLPLLLQPVQILFSNLLTDGLLGLGMGVEKAERDTMQRPPYRPDEGVFSRGLGVHVAWVGCLIGALVIGVGVWAWRQAIQDGTLSGAETLYISSVVFMTLAMLQLGRVMGTRSFRDSVFRTNPFGNMTLVAMIGVAFVAQLLAVKLPQAQPIFQTVSIGLQGVAIGAAAGVIVLLAIEVEKWLWRRADRVPSRQPLDRPTVHSMGRLTREEGRSQSHGRAV